ncbi:MAG TPA: hypothetical protein VGB23_10100 [Nitrospirota bacterium]
MAVSRFTTDTMLVIIRHPEKGEEANGKSVCNEIRKMVSGSGKPLCLLHDATNMSTANAAYASAFKDLDRDIAGRLVEVVCAIPGSIPRMMAHTVAMFSDKDWAIFKSLQEALDYLKTKGFAVTAQEVAGAGAVSVKSL